MNLDKLVSKALDWAEDLELSDSKYRLRFTFKDGRWEYFPQLFDSSSDCAAAAGTILSIPVFSQNVITWYVVKYMEPKE